MKGALSLRKPVRTPVVNNCATTNVTNAYLQLLATIGNGASAIQVQNTSAQVITLAVGSAGSEKDQVSIGPGLSETFPIELKSGDRLSAKAPIANATTGALIVNFLQ